MKYICAGANVVDKNNKSGTVISVDNACGVAVMKSLHSYWTERVDNLYVVSYGKINGGDEI